MAKGKVVLLSQNTEPEIEALIYKHKIPEAELVAVDPTNAEAVAKNLADADAIFAVRSGRITEKMVDMGKKLKLIHVPGQGTDRIPVEYATGKGIFVCNTGGANALSVAELVVCLTLMIMRRVVPYSEQLKKGDSRSQGSITAAHELYNKTVGIVGFGNIGRRVAKLMHGFGTDIIFYEKMEVSLPVMADFRAKKVSLEELLKTADVVTLHVPYLKSTRHMIGWEQLCMMKPTAYLINCARGGVIDEQALIRALKEKKIAGAGLDVFDPEPPSPDNPLLKMDNAIATPHIGATAWENWEPRIIVVWQNIARVLKGETPLNIVRES